MQKEKGKSDISFEFCDFSNKNHCQKFTELINEYITDPMGGSAELSEQQQSDLCAGMADHPSGFVLFAVNKGQIVGLTTCFINFSTFKAQKFLNIHDIIVQKQFRGYGIGRKLMEKCIDIACERNYCKVTLEVREDNNRAKTLYKSLGFNDSSPVMHFWTKII